MTAPSFTAPNQDITRLFSKPVEASVLPPLDPRMVILARATAHFLYAMAGVFKALGRALEEFAGN